MEYTVPDAVGDPFEGWRTWFVVPRDKTTGSLVLRSFIYSHVWEPEQPFEAECRSSNMKHKSEDVPDEECKCGIYALDDPEGLDKYYRNVDYQTRGLWREVYRVRGRIAMWGKVIPGELGHRCQFAYPIYIEIPKRIKHTRKSREPLLSAEEVAVNLEQAYQCKVEITEPIYLREVQ